jgi:hypothetical protein
MSVVYRGVARAGVNRIYPQLPVLGALKFVCFASGGELGH